MESETPTPQVRPAAGPRPAGLRARALLACRSCARQYDVTDLAPGDRVRCECGALLVVELQVPRAPRVLRCTNCGGELQDGACVCAYCEAEITLEERGLSEICPACHARLSSAARFCTECGVKIEPQALLAVSEDTRCPRCQSTLRSRALGTLSVIECCSCAGLWLTEEAFGNLCDDADKHELVRRYLSSVSPPTLARPQRGAAYLPCIRCGDCMVPRNFAGSSGVIIDVCRNHGVWLDHRELERVLDYVRAGGLMRARQREVERLERRAALAREAERNAHGWRRESMLFGDDA